MGETAHRRLAAPRPFHQNRPFAHSPSRSSPPLPHLAFNQFIGQAAEVLHDQIFAYLVDIDFDAQLLFQV
jgi:hypothetical protein